MVEKMQKVVCANCGWEGKRKTGNVVFCPKCDKPATFDVEPKKPEPKQKFTDFIDER